VLKLTVNLLHDQIMLQQTQVATVISYYKKWMIQFPTVKSLAAADIEVVNSIWAGLGYYSRASRLLQGAKTVMNEFNGILPIDAKDLEKIDGMCAFVVNVRGGPFADT
jgi:A/G-specific adenine glycosylase